MGRAEVSQTCVAPPLDELGRNRQVPSPAAYVRYEVLALWKSAIFLEGSFRRYLAGSTDDQYFARLGAGVEVLGRQARRRAAAA